MKFSDAEIRRLQFEIDEMIASWEFWEGVMEMVKA